MHSHWDWFPAYVWWMCRTKSSNSLNKPLYVIRSCLCLWPEPRYTYSALLTGLNNQDVIINLNGRGMNLRQSRKPHPRPRRDRDIGNHPGGRSPRARFPPPGSGTLLSSMIREADRPARIIPLFPYEQSRPSPRIREAWYWPFLTSTDHPRK